MFTHGQTVGISLAGFGYLAGFITDRVTVGDLLVIVAAMVFAAATWRTGTRKTLTEDNEALRGRVQTLEAENTELVFQKKELEDKMVKEHEEQQILRHDLKNELAAALVKTDLTGHEVAESARHLEIVNTLGQIQQVLSEMLLALQAPKTDVS